jgi:D-3-phosphoglycerate dehydrogenase
VRAVIDVQHGRVPRGVVNRAVLDAETWKKRLAALGVRHGA